MTQADRRGRAVLYGTFVLATIVFLFPYYWLATNALKSEERIFTAPPGLLPYLSDGPADHDEGIFFKPELSNFRDIFAKTPFARAFVNSVVIAVGHVALSLFLCSLGGYAFAKAHRAPGRDALFKFVLGTMLIPSAVTTIPVLVIMSRLGLMNTYWAMILPGAASAFGIFWMRQYIASNVPDELLEAARLDGCSEFSIYWRVVVPAIKPALGALAIMVLIGCWNNLMWAFIMLRTENMYTLPMLIFMLQGEQKTDYGMVMAGGLLATLPLVIAFLVFQRSFIAGITAGAVKA